MEAIDESGKKLKFYYKGNCDIDTKVNLQLQFAHLNGNCFSYF